ncbi:MAG: DUF2147 domain-containing protein [Paludibacteraceae bacterium]
MKRFIFLITIASLTTTLLAQKEFLGNWTTVSDKTGEKESIVRIFKATNGLYYGKIETLLQPEYAGKNVVCDKCKGADKGKPVEGLIIIRDMKYENGKLVGGHVLDPDSGNIYYGSITYDATTGKLTLRGSIDKRGILGRSQVWIR